MLLITYDLHQATPEDYEAVEEEILSFGPAAHIEESVWLVDTLKSAHDCRDALSEVRGDARYFVIGIERPWSSRGLDSNYVAWLKSSSRRW